MNKISLNRLEKILRLTQKMKIQIACSFIIGLPQDTIKTMRKTIKYMLCLAEEYGVRTALGFNTPFPGTPECKSAKKLGLSIHTSNWSDYDLSTPIVSTKNFSIEDLVDIYCEWTDEYIKIYKKSEKSAEVFDDLAIKN